MAVPAEDQRDWDFATAHGLPIIATVKRPEPGVSVPLSAPGAMHTTFFGLNP